MTDKEFATEMIEIIKILKGQSKQALGITIKFGLLTLLSLMFVLYGELLFVRIGFSFLTLVSLFLFMSTWFLYNKINRHSIRAYNQLNLLAPNWEEYEIGDENDV